MTEVKYHTTMQRREWDRKRWSGFDILPEHEGCTSQAFYDAVKKPALLPKGERHKALQKHNTETTNG